MRFSNHVALRFLTDPKIWDEIVTHMYPKLVGQINSDEVPDETAYQAKTLYDLVDNKWQKAYVVTDTVHDKLDMLKVKTDADGHYDWTVFKGVKDEKKTFILMPDKKFTGGGCYRIKFNGDTIEFFHICMTIDKTRDNYSQVYWTTFFINRHTNRHAEHCESQNVKDIYEFTYKLLCFIFLSENEYEEIAPGTSKGTRRQGKIKNDLPVPVTIINSKWNVTVVRTEGFGVSGHFALRRYGEGRVFTRMVFIEPYEKKGYVRKAAML